MTQKFKTRKSKGFVVDNVSGLVTGQRKLVEIGGTLYISIPKEFVEKHKLKAGERIPIVANSILKIIPVKEIE